MSSGNFHHHIHQNYRIHHCHVHDHNQFELGSIIHAKRQKKTKKEKTKKIRRKKDKIDKIDMKDKKDKTDLPGALTKFQSGDFFADQCN